MPADISETETESGVCLLHWPGTECLAASCLRVLTGLYLDIIANHTMYNLSGTACKQMQDLGVDACHLAVRIFVSCKSGQTFLVSVTT